MDTTMSMMGTLWMTGARMVPIKTMMIMMMMEWHLERVAAIWSTPGANDGPKMTTLGVLFCVDAARAISHIRPSTRISSRNMMGMSLREPIRTSSTRAEAEVDREKRSLKCILAALWWRTLVKLKPTRTKSCHSWARNWQMTCWKARNLSLAKFHSLWNRRNKGQLRLG